jgi:hypothetical protein
MRYLVVLAAAALLLSAACAAERRDGARATRPSTSTASPTVPAITAAPPTPTPTPSTILQECFAARTAATPAPAATVPPGEQQLIAVDPRLLPVPADGMIAGRWQVTEGSIATAQWSRAWDRDPADTAGAAGATRIAIQARLYLSLEDAVQDFAETASGPSGQALVQAAIEQRAFAPQNICVRAVTLDPLGVAQQTAWRVEFTRGRPEDTYVQYFVFLRHLNTRALVSTFGQMTEGKEPPRLLEDTVRVARLQAAHLRSLPTSSP